MPRELLRRMDKMSYNMKEEEEMRKGPWSEEEDLVLINYIENHGDGRWNLLARSSELKRTGKSCRLRWLNYLCPNVRRGNITPEEQLLILDLHSRFGNKWSKIARHLPGRTDNEIKNYWRTKVQKHAKQLKCDVNSTKFKDIVRHIWIPRLLERIQACSNSYPTQLADNSILPVNLNDQFGTQNLGLDNTSTTTSSNSFETRLFVSPSSQFSSGDSIQQAQLGNGGSAFEQSLSGSADHGLFDPEQWEMGENSWNVDDIWF